MTALVLDASVVIKWFHSAGERHTEAARSLRVAFEAGELLVLAPALLHLEMINVAARKWGWERPGLIELAVSLGELGFELHEPGLSTIADSTARGLTASDASYVAVAETEGIGLVTDDELIVSVAPEVAVALSSYRDEA